jgi:hypothetical protein
MPEMWEGDWPMCGGLDGQMTIGQTLFVKIFMMCIFGPINDRTKFVM